MYICIQRERCLELHIFHEVVLAGDIEVIVCDQEIMYGDIPFKTVLKGYHAQQQQQLGFWAWGGCTPPHRSSCTRGLEGYHANRSSSQKWPERGYPPPAQYVPAPSAIPSRAKYTNKCPSGIRNNKLIYGDA